MAARSTAAKLIAKVRRDTGCPSSVFTDEDIQAFLDERAVKLGQLRLEGVRVVQAHGPYVYNEYHADHEAFEDGVVIVDYDGVTTITPDGYTEDAMRGIWTLPTPSPVRRYIYLTGWLHDPNGASAVLLDDWANRMVLDFDTSADGTTMRRSQKAEALHNAAKTMRRRSRIRVGSRTRTDLSWPATSLSISQGAHDDHTA